MPAGNEGETAFAELADRFGAGDARAEDLIAASREQYSDRMRAAQLHNRDEEATAEVDWGDAASAVGVDEEQVRDVAVRGDAVIVVYEAEDGRTHKLDADREDAGLDARKGKRALPQPEEPEEGEYAGPEIDTSEAEGEAEDAEEAAPKRKRKSKS